MNTNLIPPCAYQGGKQRLAKQIVDNIFANEHIDDNTKFYDLCCGSGAYSLELINRGIHPNNIVMVDAGSYGAFWQAVANDEFDLKEFHQKIEQLPTIDKIQDYLKELSNEPINKDTKVYDYLLLQAGAFGSKQIWEENREWKNCSFRKYWLPTANSSRRSPVNPMMPMPDSLYERVKNIIDVMGGCIEAHNDYVENYYHWFDQDQPNNAVIYLDPPYKGTTGYGFEYNPYDIVYQVWNNVPIYISEGYKMDGIEQAWMLSKGRSKGNITGDIKKKPTEEWLNKFI